MTDIEKDVQPEYPEPKMELLTEPKTFMSRDYIYNEKTDTKPSLCVPHVSRCKQAPWWERDDPVYEPWLFDESISWKWHWKLEEGDYARDIHGTPGGQMKKVPDFNLTKDDLQKIVRSEPSKRLLSALHGWHQLNSKQLCAFAGIDQRNLTRYTTPLFKAGVLERGEMNIATRNEKRNYLWRINYAENYKKIVQSMKLEDYYLTTFGITTKGSRPHPRHNITASEIVLRWLETTSVFETQGVAPERLNTPKLMLPDEDMNVTGDAAIVRYDGLRVVLEITQALNVDSLVRKMHRWMKILSKKGYAETGIHVVFINCSPYNNDDMSRVLRKLHATELVPEKTGLDPDQNFRAASRITFASYRDWFPARWMISDEFLKLTTIRRRGDTAKPEDWEKIDLFGDAPIPFPASEHSSMNWYAPSETLPQLKCTPPWHLLEREVTP